MTQKTQGKAIFDNLIIAGRSIEAPALYDPASAVAEYFRKGAVYMLEEVLFRNDSLMVIDSGGANGGWVAHKIFENLANPYAVIMASLEVEVLSVGAGISASGAVSFGVGRNAATNASLSGATVDHCVVNTISLTGGAGGPQTVLGPPIPTTNTSPSDIYFNIGVTDANISADAAVVFNATYRGFLLEM